MTFLDRIQAAIAMMRQKGRTPVRVYLDREDLIAVHTDPNMVRRSYRTAFGLPLSVDDLGGGSRVVADTGEVEPIRLGREGLFPHRGEA